MLDVELPTDLTVEPETPNRKKKTATRAAPGSGGGGPDEHEAPRRLTVQELHARHEDSSDENDEMFDDLPAGDVATVD